MKTLGTASESSWGKFAGPRAYTKWVQPEPVVDAAAPKPAAAPKAAIQPAAKDSAAAEPAKVSQFQLPPRPADAIGSAEFMKRIDELNRADREAAILAEISAGNFPPFLRTLKEVPIRGQDAAGKELSATLQLVHLSRRRDMCPSCSLDCERWADYSDQR